MVYLARWRPPLPEHWELMAIIEVRDLQKSFTVRQRREDGRGVLGRLIRETHIVRAVDGVTFDIEAGEMIGYIGPNGAGKSTTIKMLTGVLVPSKGHVRVGDLEPSRRRIDLARRIGVVFGQRSQLWWDLPLADSFELLKYIYRIPASIHRSNVEKFIDLLDLAPLLATPVRQLSLGQRMRGDLAAALLHDPEFLFLDEPTIGLDVVAKARIREFLLQLNRERNVTIMLTTHDMSDIERLCRRVLVIDHGRVIFDGALEALRSRFGSESVMVVDLEETGPPIQIPGAQVIKIEGPRQWLRFRREETSAAELVAAVAAQTRLLDLAIEEVQIEDVVRHIYTGRDPLV